jgi:hypothetical protein
MRKNKSILPLKQTAKIVRPAMGLEFALKYRDLQKQSGIDLINHLIAFISISSSLSLFFNDFHVNIIFKVGIRDVIRLNLEVVSI